MDRYAALKQYLADEKPLVVPDAYDGISARLIEHAGFKAVQCSGYSFSIAHCLPDEINITLEENLSITRGIVQAVQIPVMADGEDGFGDGEVLRRNLQGFLDSGVAGINLEDQNLRDPGNPSKIINLDRMLAKLEVAFTVRKAAGKPDFIINARTDALRAMDDRKAAQKLAIERANRYLEAGADLCFIPYIKNREELRLMAAEVKGPLSVAAGLPYNIQEFNINDCRELGVARVSLPTCLIFSAMQGMVKTLSSVRDTGSFESVLDQDLIFTDMHLLTEYLNQTR